MRKGPTTVLALYSVSNRVRFALPHGDRLQRESELFNVHSTWGALGESPYA